MQDSPGNRIIVMWGQVDARYVMDIKASYILFAVSAIDEIRDVVAAFNARGAEVRLAKDGAEAWHLIHNGSRLPDVLFVQDLMLNIDGMELIHMFHRHYPNAPTMVVFACCKASTEGVIGDWEWPLDSMIVRPYSFDQAVVAIEQMYFRDVRRPAPET